MTRHLFAAEKSRRLIFVLIVCTLSLLVVSLRLNGFSGVPGKLLWAEDGQVFLAGAIEHGLAAVLEPYAGYLHLYARSVAYLASQSGPRLVPYVMLGGWVAGYLAAALFVVRALRLTGIKAVVALAAVLTGALAPTSGETLFTITNVQWHLGAALAILVLMPTSRKPVLSETIFVAIASLTGPFSIILLPLILLRIALFRDAYPRQRVDVIVVVCALVQLSYFVASDRLGVQTSKEPGAWGSAFVTFVTFGAQGRVSLIASIVFWVVFASLLISRIIAGEARDRDSKATVLLLIASGFFMLAGLYAVRQDPAMASPLGAGARYFVIPYFLIVISAALIGNRHAFASAIMLVALLVVDYQEFRAIDRFDYGYESYVDFAAAHEGVVIPINPRFDGHQFGYEAEAAQDPHHKALARKIEPGALVRYGKGQWALRGTSIGCAPGTQTLGLEVVLKNKANGTLSAAWSDDNHGRQQYTVRAGSDTGYLALPWETGKVLDLVVDTPGKGDLEAGIASVNAFCVVP
ncbi:hypothetical protein VDQ74_09435 [Xanthomonas campestris pv. campestris]|nr:hypothetical protein [Xanthomonas campestris pv. campestris]